MPKVRAGSTGTPATRAPANGRAMLGVGGYLDDRTRGAKAMRYALRKVFPDHWTYLLGEISLYTFVILLLTGTFLTLFFQPSMTQVIYHGSYVPLRGVQMSEAYASTLNISFDVRGGLLMRQVHHWAALLFIASMLAHLLRIFYHGAFRRPRELNWVIGIILLTLAIIEGFAGYSLPDDLLSGTGLRILEGVLLSIPIVGTYLTLFLFGGQYPGNDIVPRLYIVHVLVVPGLILALITAHLFLVFLQKHSHNPGKGRSERNVVGPPFYPHFLTMTGSFFMFVFAACTLAGAFAQINPIWLFGPYNPVAVSAGSQPDFYMGWLEGGLRLMPPWHIVAFGHSLNLGVLIPGLLIFGLLMTGLALYPFLERWITGDNLEHHIVERPRNAPTRTAIGNAGVTFYGVLWLVGGNDLIAKFMDVPLYWTTWIGRVAIFVGPVIAYIVTKRMCLALQRKDHHLLEHGVETGIIRQLPTGEFVEETRPLDENERAVLLSRAGPLELPATASDSSDPVLARDLRRPVGRLRVRLRDAFQEGILPNNGYSELTGNGHGSGHGNGNGSGTEKGQSSELISDTAADADAGHGRTASTE